MDINFRAYCKTHHMSAVYGIFTQKLPKKGHCRGHVTRFPNNVARGENPRQSGHMYVGQTSHDGARDTCLFHQVVGRKNWKKMFSSRENRMCKKAEHTF